MFKGFRNKTIEKRQDIVNFPFKSPLDSKVFNHLIENCIGSISLPIGLALNFNINNIPLVIPVSIEEPSIVAALSSAAKTCVNFTANCENESNTINAQIYLTEIPNIDIAICTLNENKQYIIDTANTFCTSMVNRGGGVIDSKISKIPRKTLESLYIPQSLSSSSDKSDRIILNLEINVCEAMGANITTHIAEGLSPFLTLLTPCVPLIKIVSNYTPKRLVTSEFKIDLNSLEYKGTCGKDVGMRIIEANCWAKDDINRAVTHNKGIMNGIDGVLIAIGQDFRAVEACVHAWASRTGRYESLTNYWIEEMDNGSYNFCGNLSIPICIGVKNSWSNPFYNYTLDILGSPTSQQTSHILASVGLAQNFAALKTLVTEGIQRGHMNLHNKRLNIPSSP
jgi:degradative hydroxymethylglutaryl-CoA reductase